MFSSQKSMYRSIHRVAMLEYHAPGKQLNLVLCTRNENHSISYAFKNKDEIHAGHDDQDELKT